MHDDDPDPPPLPRRKRRRPEPPPGMSTRTILMIVFGTGFCFAGLIAAGAWMAMKQRDKRATDEELRAEREADRIEAVAAFANPVPPTPEDSAEFRRFFDGLGSAIDRGDVAHINTLFDGDRLGDELFRNGTLDNVPMRDRASFRRGMREGARDSFGNGLVQNELLRWNRTEIRRIRWSADRSEAVVIAAHHQKIQDVNVRMKMRWWMIRRGNEWRLYDFEDLDMGSRASLLVKSIFAGQDLRNIAARAAEIRENAAHIREAMVVILKEKDADAAEQAIANCRGRNLPNVLAAMKEMIEGLILAHRGQPAPALEKYAAAERLQPAMPMMKLLRASALCQLQRWAEALDEARAYTAELGPDAQANGTAGIALEGLGRNAEALESFRTGLDDDPDDAECLAGFLRMLPAESKSEIVVRLEKTSQPMAKFEELLREARVAGDEAGAAALFAWLRKTKPDDIRGRTEELRLLVNSKKFGEAAALFKKELGQGTDDARRQILHAWLNAMSAVGKDLEAYEAVPKDRATTALRHLGDNLNESLEEQEPGSAEMIVTRLEELIGAHRKRDPGDPWLNAYQGAILKFHEKPAEAEAAFTDGVKRLVERPGADDAEDLAERFRYNRVECHFALKQPLKAYSAVGPSTATFRQIADHFDQANDAAGLAAIVAAHRKEFPQAVELKYWQAEIEYLNAKYESAAAGFRAFHRAAEDDVPERFRAVERCVRSWVRANKPVEARAAVLGLGGEKVAANLRADVEAASGNVAGVERILAEATKNDVKPWIFYYDEDFVRLTAGPQFAALRAKYPDPRPKPPMGKAG